MPTLSTASLLLSDGRQVQLDTPAVLLAMALIHESESRAHRNLGGAMARDVVWHPDALDQEVSTIREMLADAEKINGPDDQRIREVRRLVDRLHGRIWSNGCVRVVAK